MNRGIIGPRLNLSLQAVHGLATMDQLPSWLRVPASGLALDPPWPCASRLAALAASLR
jgi:hypothetical protein